MKIRILVILYLSSALWIFAKEQTTHTFKNHNFRISLPSYWEIQKNFESHKNKPLVIANSREENLFLEIYAEKKSDRNLRNSFLQTLKHQKLWAENYLDLDQVAEFPIYNLEGYWARTMGYQNKKKILGYLVYATDGVNTFTIHAFTYANLFPKNFISLKNLLQEFTLNVNYKSECCLECLNSVTNATFNTKTNCSELIETEECFFYFQNRPYNIKQCQ
ncbi:MAG: hypothetical protein IPL26_00955 [Leptospiraceae bacterium]|nr:hypothetical protein [Leptospiraceae bacterium]